MTPWQKVYVVLVAFMCLRLQCKLDELEHKAEQAQSQADWAASRANAAYYLADEARR